MMRSTGSPLNAIDGDLVELLLDLPNEDMEQVIAEVPPSDRLPLPEILKLVEDLQRLH
jgi:hypothetical protein